MKLNKHRLLMVFSGPLGTLGLAANQHMLTAAVKGGSQNLREDRHAGLLVRQMGLQKDTWMPYDTHIEHEIRQHVSFLC